MAQKSFNYIEHATGNHNGNSNSSVDKDVRILLQLLPEGRVRWTTTITQALPLVALSFKVSQFIIYERIWGNQWSPQNQRTQMGSRPKGYYIFKTLKVTICKAGF